MNKIGWPLRKSAMATVRPLDDGPGGAIRLLRPFLAVPRAHLAEVVVRLERWAVGARWAR